MVMLRMFADGVVTMIARVNLSRTSELVDI